MAKKICEFDKFILMIEYVEPEEDCKNEGFFIVRKLQSIDDFLFENEEEVFKYLQDLHNITKEEAFKYFENIRK